jgi:hypothetical protein
VPDLPGLSYRRVIPVEKKENDDKSIRSLNFYSLLNMTLMKMSYLKKRTNSTKQVGDFPMPSRFRQRQRRLSIIGQQTFIGSSTQQQLYN